MSPRPITDNTLFYGDKLYILREYIPSNSIDLIYLDSFSIQTTLTTLL